VLQHGPVTSARWGWYHFTERYFDQHLGIHTARRPEFDQLDEYGAESVRYEPLPYSLVRTALAAAVQPATVGRDVFLDYGAGLGRVVIMAATHPFKRVLGVELLERLTRLAAENLRAARGSLKAPAEVLTRDARQFEVPDDVTIACLFNPFTGEVMADVQRRIEASLRRAPRRLQVIYAHPDDQANLFASCRWLGAPRRLPVGVFSRLNLMVYETPAA
jgi:predicted RNA methylase